MPPVRTGANLLPGAKVALMWVPLSFGNPEIAKNHPQHWWPGKAYVDWVGTTWYSPYRRTSAMHRMYSFPLWRSKPFAFAEWGVWGRGQARLRRPVLPLPQIPPTRAHGGLLPVRGPEAGVPPVDPPGLPGGAAPGGQVAAADRGGAVAVPKPRRWAGISALCAFVVFSAANAIWAFEQPAPGSSGPEPIDFYTDLSSRIVVGGLASLFSIAISGSAPRRSTWPPRCGPGTAS
jgi:hypothetical protein